MPINKVFCGTSTTDDLLTAVNALIDQGQTNLDTIQQLLLDLSALETQVGQIDIDLDTEVARLDGDLSSLETSLTNLINANTAAIQSNDSDIAGLRTDVDSNTSDIAGLRSDTDANTAAISNNSSAIASNAAAIQSNDSDIAGLRTDTDTNTSNISGLRSDVDTLYPWAMRKVEFEAIRAANNEEYAANGFVYFGKHRDFGNDFEAINEGLYTYTLGVDRLFLGRSSSVSNTEGESKEDLPVLLMGGVTTQLIAISASDVYGAMVKLPPAEDGTRTYDSATDASVIHATPALAFAAETATNKVVTDRVDMWGFEAFLREITDSDPFVYKNGLIQSLATDINGVGTVSDYVQPITYFAWYEGDTASRGLGVNWQTATESQRIAIARDPKNNIYFDDSTGKFYQWCVRGRSFAGAGNGDWLNVESQSTVGCRFDLNSSTLVKIQGPADNTENTAYADHTSRLENPNPQIGAFTARNDSNGAIDGESYFYVADTITRLNTGGHHPSFNPLGTRGFSNQDGTSSLEWHQSGARKPITRSDCFDYAEEGSGYPYTTGKVFGTIVGVAGAIVGGDVRSGRPDGRYYDAIYASGQGGVCRDMRYSAWGLTAEDFAEQDLKIKSGEYRGRERLPFSLPIVVGENSLTTYISLGNTKPEWWDVAELGTGPTKSKNISDMFLTNPSTGEKLYVTMTGYTESSNIGWFLRLSKTQYDASSGSNQFHNLTAGDVLILQTQGSESLCKTSIAGEYVHTEIIGDPANIILCDDLKDGWVGGWNPEIPNNQTTKVLWTKPVDEVPPVGSVLITDNNGGTWSSGTVTAWFNPFTNSSNQLVLNLDRIIVAFYKTKAKMTTLENNGVVYGGYKGIGSVFYTSYFDEEFGSLLGYSLTGKVLIQGSGALAIGTSEMESKVLNKVGRIASDSTGSIYPDNTHSPLLLAPPTHNSPAFKALDYNVVDKQQGFINYAYTELTYDTTAGDWGDDGKINISDYETTMLDENGNTVLVGTARCVEPLGWIKNDK